MDKNRLRLLLMVIMVLIGGLLVTKDSVVRTPVAAPNKALIFNQAIHDLVLPETCKVEDFLQEVYHSPQTKEDYTTYLQGKIQLTEAEFTKVISDGINHFYGGLLRYPREEFKVFSDNGETFDYWLYDSEEYNRKDLNAQELSQNYLEEIHLFVKKNTTGGILYIRYLLTKE